jgi:hypothetical protein
MLFPDTGLWGLRSEMHQPILAINPWADRPLPDFLKPFRRFEAESEKWILKDGQTVADVCASEPLAANGRLNPQVARKLCNANSNTT